MPDLPPWPGRGGVGGDTGRPWTGPLRAIEHRNDGLLLTPGPLFRKCYVAVGQNDGWDPPPVASGALHAAVSLRGSVSGGGGGWGAQEGGGSGGGGGGKGAEEEEKNDGPEAAGLLDEFLVWPVCVCACVRACVRACACVRVRACACAYLCECVCVCVFANAQPACVRACVYACVYVRAEATHDRDPPRFPAAPPSLRHYFSQCLNPRKDTTFPSGLCALPSTHPPTPQRAGRWREPRSSPSRRRARPRR